MLIIKQRRRSTLRQVATEQNQCAEVVTTTDLDVLTKVIDDLNELWEAVLNYPARKEDTRLKDVRHAAYVYFRAVSALAKFEAEYRPAKKMTEQNFELALRLSGMTMKQLADISGS